MLHTVTPIPTDAGVNMDDKG